MGYFFKNDKKINQRFEKALKSINHRGPDDKGYKVFSTIGEKSLILGHTRLSILDLSSAGHQPMSSEDGNITIVFNGEIYNYIELRQELQAHNYKFSTGTDTEVLLNAYHFWGAECLPKLIGMFAFSIYDRKNNKVVLARDAFGIKPLFYIHKEDIFVFGSEINSLLELVEDKPTPDLQTAYDYLVHSDCDSSERTFFNGIKQLRPASYIELNLLDNTHSESITWWKPSVGESSDISFDDAVVQVRDKFLNSVKLHLRSDVSVGAALSGGVDSSAIVCAMRYIEPDLPIHTFSYIAKGSLKSEEKWVDLVNNHIGAIPHKVTATPKELMVDLNDLIKAQGEPFGSTSIYAQYRVFKLAKEQGIQVTLDGQGADELLAGYIGYPGERMLSLFEVEPISLVFRFLNKWSKYPDRSYKKGLMYFGRKILPDILYKNVRKLMGRNPEPKWLDMDLFKAEGVLAKENRMAMSLNGKGRRVIEQLVYSIHNRGLPALLRYGDRNSMKFSIESRVPFLTTDLADYLYSLPEKFLISEQGETKHVFREAMKGILPDEILERKDKIGFEADSVDWKDLYKEEICELLINSPCNLIKKSVLVDKQNNLDEKSYWRILNYLKWYKLHF